MKRYFSLINMEEKTINEFMSDVRELYREYKSKYNFHDLIHKISSQLNISDNIVLQILEQLGEM